MENNTKRIPFAVIVAATSGDEAAIHSLTILTGRAFLSFPLLVIL